MVEENTSLCVAVCGKDGYSWYDVNLASTEAVTTICQASLEDVPFGFTSVPLGSKIFVIGGIECDQSICCTLDAVPSSRVFSFDPVAKAPAPLSEDIRMFGGKASPIVACFNGNLHVFGFSYGPENPAEPWAEVFDPNERRWDALPYPSDQVLSSSLLYSAASHVLYEKEQKLLVYYHNAGLCSFDARNKLWQYNITNDLDFRQLFVSSLALLIVGDILYMFLIQPSEDPSLQSQENCLYAYHLQHNKLAKVHLEGFEKVLVPDSSATTSLCQLGQDYLCLVLGAETSGYTYRFHCLQFHVYTDFKGISQAHARVVQRDTFHLQDAQLIFDIFILKRESPICKGPLCDKAVPVPLLGVEQPLLSSAWNSQATRHASRVYVGGLPYSAENQLKQLEQIKRFFTDLIVGPRDPDAVVYVYLNKEKCFAIVEMRSMEEAKTVLELDGIYFKGAKLEIRRPGDYNPKLNSDFKCLHELRCGCFKAPAFVPDSDCEKWFKLTSEELNAMAMNEEKALKLFCYE